MLQYSLGPPYTRLPTPHKIRGAGATDQRSEEEKGKSAASRIFRKMTARLSEAAFLVTEMLHFKVKITAGRARHLQGVRLQRSPKRPR